MRRKQILTAAMFAFVICLSLCGYSDGDTIQQNFRPDIITIVAKMPLGELERAPVQFPHDVHTEAMKERDEDCTYCHPVRENGKLSRLFMRLENAETPDVEALYHDRCVGCHIERAAEDAKTEPVSCGDCHRKQAVYGSSRQPFGFDKSLHYRHIKANNEKCESCHHIYDEESKKLVYVEGQEDPCRDCHRTETEDNRSSFNLAAHESCIGCHREVSLARPLDRVGPQSCAGCHDQQNQAAIEVVEQPPRLKRGQPDFVLLSAPDADLELSKLNTVPFSHDRHEQATTTCRGCHHESLARCNDCHNLSGSEKGSGISLQQAMHRLTSIHSCAGCHEAEKADSTCAGCHDLMESARLSEHACGICHAGPSPDDVADARAIYTSPDAFRPAPPEIALTIPASEIPDTVTIGTLTKQYSPVKMPHRKIVNALRKHIADSRIATYFHGHEDVVCRGCHHHGSVGRKPALCENCHGEPFRENDLFKPGLKGAYHRQCLGCHLSMGKQTVSNCAVCHDTDSNAVGDVPPDGGEPSNE